MFKVSSVVNRRSAATLAIAVMSLGALAVVGVLRARQMAADRADLVPTGAPEAPGGGGSKTEGIDRQDRCTERAADGVRITENAIGVLDLRRSVAELRRVCPSARDTVMEGQEGVLPAVVFHLWSLTAVGIQPQRDSLDPAMPAELWVVSGHEGRLASGLTLRSKWREVHTVLGRGMTDLESLSNVLVEFCRAPRIQFELRMSVPEGGGGVGGDDLSFIPDSTAIAAVWVYPGAHVRSLCAGE